MRNVKNNIFIMHDSLNCHFLLNYAKHVILCFLIDICFISFMFILPKTSIKWAIGNCSLPNCMSMSRPKQNAIKQKLKKVIEMLKNERWGNTQFL